MGTRGRISSSFEGRTIQAPGMMRHGPFPGGLEPASLRPQPLPDVLENRIAAQEADMEKLVRENRKLASTHVVLRQDLTAAQQEMQRIQAHVRSFQTESDIQVRGLLEKIGKMEAEIRAGESVKKELQQAHLEAQSLLAARQKLTSEIQQVTEELQKVNAEVKSLPIMHDELDGLRQEHHRLRVAFEHEKGSNVEQVEKMQGMERNLISTAREIERLRAEVLIAEKGTPAPNPYIGTYSSPDTVYPLTGQVGGYADSGGSADYGHGGAYSNPGFGHGDPAGYPQAYGMLHPQQMSIGAAGEAVNPYSLYSNGYGRPQIAGGAVAGGEGMEMNPYGGVSSVAPYDPAKGGFLRE